MKSQFVVYDVETLSNLFTYTGYNCSTKEFVQYVICDWRNDIEELIKHLKSDIIHVGYNNENFDYPIIHNIINNFKSYEFIGGLETAKRIYAKSQELIDNEFNTISDKNKYIPQIDLYKIWHYDSNAKHTSLKDLEFSLRMPNVEDMPIHHATLCKQGDEEIVLAYNKNDVEATYQFFLSTLGRTDNPLYHNKNKLELRKSLESKFGVQCLNLPDIRIGEKLMLHLYAKAINKSPNDIRKLSTKRSEVALKDCIPSWCDIKSDLFKQFLHKISTVNVQIPLTKDVFEFSIIDTQRHYKWDFGLGGSHGCCDPGIYVSDNQYVIRDYDISSLYPSIAKSLQLYPEHLGPEFVKLYSQFIDARINEKHKPKDMQDQVLIEGYKLILNGLYGKSNEESSFMYDPLYTFKTTIAGQVFICMWSERLISACPEIKFLQSNTDGQTVLIPRDKINIIQQVNEQLTKETGLIIEEAEYSKMIIRDVNSYIGVYSDNTADKPHLKLKGDFEVDKEYHKDSSMRIVPLAVKEYFVNNIPIEQTIRNHKDIFDFCLRLKLNSTTNGKFRHFDSNFNIVEDKLSKTTRYYISSGKNSGSIIKDFGEKKSSVNVGFQATIFNKFESKKIEEYNINYSFYIQEANKLKNAVNDGQLSLF